MFDMDDFEFQLDGKLKEECGVFGIYEPGCEDISTLTYFGLIALQHRGQESAGIAVYKDNNIKYYKDMGLVQEVFNGTILGSLKGDISVGHVRYSTTGESYLANAQPLVVKYRGGSIALAHNGNLINADAIRNEMEDNGTIFQTSIDSEVIAALIAKNYKGDIVEAVKNAVAQIKGAYSLVICCEGKLIGLRDPHGLRPLALGRIKKTGGFVLSSETVGLDVVDAELIREIEPGELVVIDQNGVESITYSKGAKKALCSFEFVYFARPDSVMEGRSVYNARINAGKALARLHPVEADMVISVPDSGTAAAIGYAQESCIPYGAGLIKNKYLGRTFIQPDQKSRELGVKLKLNVLKDNVKGKRIIMIDDSIVRGTTSKRIVDMLREAGATEIHMRVSSPPVKYSCYFGIDTPEPKQLVGATMSVEEIRELIGVDSLGYLTDDGLLESIGLPKEGMCTACFRGEYPMDVPKLANKYVFEKA